MTTASQLPRPFILDRDRIGADQAEALWSGAVVAHPAVALLDVTGPGAVLCLQGLVTCDLDGPGDGGYLYGAILTPKGMIVADLWAARAGTTVTITCPSDGLPGLREVFLRSLPPRLARLIESTPPRVTLRLAGPEAIAVAEQAGIEVPPPGRTGQGPCGPSDCRANRPAGGEPFALELHAPASDAPAIHDALTKAGAVTASPETLELGRIQFGWPRLGAEIDGRTLPQEVRYDELGGVSYTKGCYTGQETVARLHFRGHANRGLLGLVWQDAPDPGQPEVRQGDKVIGRVSSVAWCPPIEQYIGLGILRREVDRDRPVQAAEAPARVAELPFKLDG